MVLHCLANAMLNPPMHRTRVKYRSGRRFQMPNFGFGSVANVLCIAECEAI
jgi:hypothetical protein